jgi:PHD/YefM family antitoxin component YafN of YafNO toxin-antitoxin module
MEAVAENLYTVQTVQKIEAILQRLSPERLRVAADFLAYLDERESNDATEELLSIPNFLEDYQEAMQDIENGDVVPLKIIRRHV